MGTNMASSRIRVGVRRTLAISKETDSVIEIMKSPSKTGAVWTCPVLSGLRARRDGVMALGWIEICSAKTRSRYQRTAELRGLCLS